MDAWLESVRRNFIFTCERRGHGWKSILPRGDVALGFILTALLGVVLAHQYLDPIFMRFFQMGTIDLDGVFSATTMVGNSGWMITVTGSILLFMSCIPVNRIVFTYRVQWHQLALKLHFLFLTLIVSGLGVIGLKNLIGRARPIRFNGEDLWFSQPFTDTFNFASFPSGHSTTMGALVIVSWLIVPRLFKYVLLIALYVGFTRIAVGKHYPSDVFAGLAVGAAFAWFMARAFASRRLLFDFAPDGSLRIRDEYARSAKRRLKKFGKEPLGTGILALMQGTRSRQI